MLRIIDITDKWNSWLADITFDWRLVMETAVERNNQTYRFITFLRSLFYKIYTKTSQIMNKNDAETKCKHNRWISFFWHSSKYEPMGPMQKLTYFAQDPLHSYFDECPKNGIYFLNGFTHPYFHRKCIPDATFFLETLGNIFTIHPK